MENKLRKIIQELGNSKISSAAYDTAWIAQLAGIDNSLGYRALEWIREHQLADGTWGANHFVHHHDRVICTVAAMISLEKFGTQEDDVRIQRARHGLDFALKGISADASGATVGFEMLLPSMLTQTKSSRDLLRNCDLNFDQMASGLRKKLSSQPDKVINRDVSMAFSAELANDQPEMLNLSNIQEQNGSLGGSPAATAYYALVASPGNQEALDYLQNVTEKFSDGSAPQVYPFNTYEIAWSLWNLSLINNFVNDYNQVCQSRIDLLEKSWNSRGMSYASDYSLFDGDNTTVGFEILTRFGRTVDIQALLDYEIDDRFRCYKFETDPSVGTNIHALCALREYGYPSDHPTIKKINQFLEQSKQCESFWFDKWHASPYYATAHAIIACAGFLDDQVPDSIRWIVETQNQDGSWGYYGATAEETAYCLQALLIYQRYGGSVSKDALRKGLDWLGEHMEPPYSPMWICKCLYSPETIVRSAIISALTMGSQEA